MTSKVIEGHKSSSNFSVNPTLPLLDGPLMLPPPNCVYLSLSHSISFSLPLSFSYCLYISLSISLFRYIQKLIYTQRNVFHKIKYDIKGHMRPFLCRVILKKFQIFYQITTLTYVLMDNFCPCFFHKAKGEIERDIERESKRKRGEERTRWRVRERSTQFGVGSINGPSIRGRVGLTLKLDEIL